MDCEALIAAVKAIERAATTRDKADLPAVTVPAEKLSALLRRLRDEPALAFDMLLDHTAIDWLERGQLELVYNLLSTMHGHSLMVTVLVDRSNPQAPTASDIWQTAHWQEREVYDLFGVLYDGHADLRRVFLEDHWKGHPLRKDYQDDHMLELPQ